MKSWTLSILILFVSIWSIWADQKSSKQIAFGKASDYYARIVSDLVSTNVPFADYYKPPFTLTEMGLDLYDDYHGEHARVRGQFSFWIGLANGKITSVRNLKLQRYVETNSVQKIPRLSVEQAVECAKKYMSILGISPSKNMSLSKISFHSDYASCWLLVWEPIIEGFHYDTFFTSDIQQFRIIFHEQYGFTFYSEHNTWPSPKQTVVKLSKEFAILKASKAISLIQKSPYYLQCRMPGFVASGLHKAELLIAAPNWLLDPKRAIWLRDKPPDETRLCWVVTFTSVYTGKEDPGTMAVPPMFIVYIDAATGEIVGANFT